MANEWYGGEAPEEIIESTEGGSSKVSFLQTFESQSGENVLSVNQLVSSNFDGSFSSSSNALKAINTINAGEYIYLDNTNNPLSSLTGIDNYGAFIVDNVSVGASDTTVTVIIDSSSYNIVKPNATNVAYRTLDTITTAGTNGWAISSNGDAIFNNITARGTIEALSGKFGDWAIGAYNTYNGLYYSYNDGTNIIESAVGPLDLYLKSNTIFGNYSWHIGSAPDADTYMAVLKDLSKATTPVNLQPIFYVSETGIMYSIYGEFEKSLVSYGPLTSYSDGVTPSADLYTNYTGQNAIHAQQTNTGQTATVLRLDSARTTTLASYHFIRAYSAVGTAADEEFQVLLNGVTRGDGAYSSPTADYAEFFEWQDGNANSEDRVGYSVSLVGNKIKIAENGEIPIGIISATPSIIGDSPWNRWKDKYLKDDFGRELYEPCIIYQWEEDRKLVNYFSDRIPDGITVPEDKEVINSERKVLNPDFNEELEYLSRDDRPEWDTVGLLGKIRLRKGQITAPTWIKLRDISENVEEWLVK